MQISDNWHEKIGEICKCGVLGMVRGWEIGCQIPGPEKKNSFFYFTTLHSISTTTKKRGILFGLFINKIKFNPCVNSLWMYQLIKGMDGRNISMLFSLFPICL